MIEIKETEFLEKLTDDFGVWQHTKQGVIRRDMGYALDDSARALIVYLLYEKPKYAEVCLSYIEHSFKEGNLVGFFDENKQVTVFPASHDAFGLAIWALAYAKSKGFEAERCNNILSKLSWDEILKEKHLRALTYLLISSCYLKDRENARKIVDILLEKYDSTKVNWFEDSLYYANAVIPLALIMYLNTFDDTRKKKIEGTILEAIATLEKEMRIGIIPAPIGNHVWYKIGEHNRDIYGQQPIDAGFMVILLVEAFKYFNDSIYLAKAEDWMNWFNGNNIWKTSLITQENACNDGLDEYGVNEDKGAESTILYLWAKCTLQGYKL